MATSSVDRDNLLKSDLKDVIVASAFGRGHWLASHLADQGWKVTLLDFTSALDECAPEDYDSPFGLLETDLISGSQKSHWVSELGANSTVQIKNGFSVWLNDGPLEGHGSMATFLAQERSLALSVRNYLHMVSDLSDIRLKAERVQLAKLPFETTWLVRFMHQIHSNVFIENDEALESEHAAPFFASYHLRSVSSASHGVALRNLRAKGVEVLESNPITAIIPEGDEKVTVQIGGSYFTSRSFVWTLSSVETSKAAKDLMRAFYPQGEVARTWSWQRFEVRFAEQPIEVPEAFVILQDPHLPWTHTNTVAVQAKENKWDCWVKLPIARITEPAYRQQQMDDLAILLNKKLPWAGAKVSDVATRSTAWSLYDPAQKKKLRTDFSKNVFISGPEHWNGIDPLSQMLSMREVLNKLESVRRIWDARQAKREAKEALRLQKQKEREERKRQ